MLELAGVSSGYGRLPVLFDIDMYVDPGEVVAVLGPNGAGKSTLLKTILGSVHTREGAIAYNGKRITNDSIPNRFKQGISLSPEGRRMFKHLSVKDNLVSGTYGRSATTVNTQIERVFAIFPRLGERQSQAAGSLSGGEQQMLAISRALVSNPQLLMIDELSMGLAPMVVQQLYDILRELAGEGLGIIVVDQFAPKTLATVNRAYVLEKGRVAFSGPPLEAAEHMSSGYMVTDHAG